MKSVTVLILTVVLMATLAGCGSPADDHADVTPAEPIHETEPTPDEKVAELDQMCAEAQEAMAARQAESTLFERVGGREGLQVVVTDTVRRHQINEEIKHLMDGVDSDHLAMQVTDFLVVGTGGDGDYKGRDMVAAHEHLHLSNADFLAAGGDLGASMNAAGWGEDEKQELLCAFVALRPDVVT